MKQSFFFKIFALSVLSFVIFFATIAYAATNQWENISTGTTGPYNTIAVMDNYVYVGTDHGVYRSDDGGTTWTLMTGISDNVTSLAIGWVYNSGTNIYEVTPASFIFAGTDTGVFVSTLGDTSWIATSTGVANVTDIEIDQSQAATGSYTNIYAVTPIGVYISVDMGSTWQFDGAGMIPSPTKIVSTIANRIYSLTDANTVYGADLYSSNPGTFETWSQIFDAGATTTSDIGVVRAQGFDVWLSTGKGIYKSDDTATIFASTSIGLPNDTVNNVASDYINTNIAYASFLGSGIYRTINEAIENPDPQIPEWLPINKNLSDLNIKDVETNPSDSSVVYAVGSSGIYKLTYDTSSLQVPEIDLTPPSAVTDLSVSATTTASAILIWTAPGNDGTFGTSTSYDIRYSTSTITDGNWASATGVSPQPTPFVSGHAETYMVIGLDHDTVYFFALKSSDGVNESALSYVVVSTTSDVTAPTISFFGIPSTSSSLTVPVSLAAFDDVGLTGFLVSESASIPSLADPNWVVSTPISYSFASEGMKTLYVWVKDAAGNLSASSSASVEITLPVSGGSNPSFGSVSSGGSRSSGSGNVMSGVLFPNTGIAPASVTPPIAELPYSTVVFSIGMRNSQITDLQKYLVSRGYMAAQNVTGYYGPITDAALSKYKNAIAISSIAIIPTSGLFVRQLALGARGIDVLNLQRFLNKNGFIVSTSGGGSPGNETQFFGPATTAALIKFQNYYATEILIPNGLSIGTGIFGPATMKKVNSMPK